MSYTTRVQTDSQLTVGYDNSKIFIGNNKYKSGTFKNLSGGTLSYDAGLLIGRIAATGMLVPCTSAAADGSQKPLGILTRDITDLANNGEKTVNFCISGEVAEEKLGLSGTDTLDTVFDGQILRDGINGKTLGIQLVASTEMTGEDNY